MSDNNTDSIGIGPTSSSAAGDPPPSSSHPIQVEDGGGGPSTGATKLNSRLQLKVFQASPLAFGDIPIPFLDLDEEEYVLREALRETNIDVSFEIATAHGISTFLAQGQSFLHLSCHGHPKQLFIEDGYGGCHILVVGENLKRWITAGGQKLNFVFVSACHSRSAGEAFIDAGVPYVVCCEQDGYQLLDQAARIFAKGFYTAVANGLTNLQQAYELAKNQVIQAPEIQRVQGVDPEAEAKKFVLLMNNKVSNSASTAGDVATKDTTAQRSSSSSSGKQQAKSQDTPRVQEKQASIDNEVSDISFKLHSTYLMRKNLKDDRDKAKQEKQKQLQDGTNGKDTALVSTSTMMLPIPPQPFLERELDMYRILKSLFIDRRKVRLVRIKGEKGIGKVALAKAIAQYVKKRNMWGPILWLPPLSSSNSSRFSEGSTMFKNAIAQAILENYQNEKALLIIDTTKFSQHTIASLCSFLDDVFERTKYLKVIVIEKSIIPNNDDDDDDDDTNNTNSNNKRGANKKETKSIIQSQKYPGIGFMCFDKSFELKQLTPEATVFLFCHSCPHVKSWGKAMKGLQHKVATDPNAMKVLGQGNPTRILLMAKNISPTEFDTLTHMPKKHTNNLKPIQLDDYQKSLQYVEDIMMVDNSNSAKRRKSSNHQYLNFDIKNLMIEDSEEDKANNKNATTTPLRTQEEIIDRFVPIFKTENKVYRKAVRSFIRKASKGEHIVTIINGVPATENTVMDDNSWIVCGQVAGEYYPLTDEKVHMIYDTQNPEDVSQDNEYLHNKGFKAYRSKRQIYGHKVDESDMDFFRQGMAATTEEAHFMAPWGTPIRVELGDYLVLQYPNGQDDIYRIECNLFERSYADIENEEGYKAGIMDEDANPTSDDLKNETVALEERMAQYREENPNFAGLESDIRRHLHTLMGALDRQTQQQQQQGDQT